MSVTKTKSAKTDKPIVSPSVDAMDFLTGGEMAKRMREKDWSATELGTPESWPQSLLAALSICLNANYPIAIYWGEDLVLLYNDSWSPIPGEKHPWALGRPAREAWSDIWEIIEPLFRQVMNGGGATRRQDQLLPMRRYGFTEECYFDYTFSPIFDEAGRIGGVFNAVVETTQRVIGERRLQTLRELTAVSASQLRTVTTACENAAAVLAQNPFDLPFALVYLLDDEGRTASLAGAAGLEPGSPPAPLTINLSDPKTAWPFAEVLGSERPVIVGGLAERFDPIFGRAWPEPVQQADIRRFPKSDGTSVSGFIVAGLSPRITFDDLYQGFNELIAGGVATILTNARAYEEEKKRAEELAELDRAKTEFFSNVSHEFRTPLTLMIGNLEDVLTKNGDIPSDEKSRLASAHRNSLRLLKLVNTLLDFSSIEAGRQKMNLEPVDLCTLTKDLASNFRSAIEREGIKYTVDCEPLPRLVAVDNEMWEKIVLNLLSNAFKFTFEGEIEVKLRPDSLSSAVVLTVRDTGVGIPPSEIEKIFDRFHRVTSTQGRTHEGTGIGLALVKELVKMHGGQISAESSPGEGSVFTVTIPMLDTAFNVADRITAYKENRTPAEIYLNDLATTGESAKIARAGPATANILLADDNADMREYVANLLLRSGYAVTAVRDGNEAFETALREQPDLILTDVMMPRLDGFGLLRKLRANEATRSVPVVMLSARAGEESRIEGLEIGADDYLIKPFSARELLARIRSVLELGRVRRENEKILTDRDERLTASNRELERVVSELHEANRENQKARRAALNLLEDTIEAKEQLRESEEKYRGIVNQAVAGVAETNLNGRFISVNDQYCRITGRTREELFNLTIADITHPDDFRLNVEKLERLVAEGTPFDIEKRYVRPDGSHVWVYNNVYAVKDAEGRARSIAAVVVDITARKIAEHSLSESEDRFRSFVTTSSDIIYRMSPDWSHMLSLQGKSFIADTNDPSENWIEKYILPEDRPEVLAAVERAIETRSIFELEHRVITAEGGVGWTFSRAVPRFDDSGKIIEWFGAASDVTERHIAEEKLRESEERFRNMADYAPVMVWVTDATGYCSYLSQSWFDFTGQTPENGLGFGWVDAVHPDDRDNAERIFLESNEKCAEFRFEYRLRRKDGEYRWAIDSARPRFSETGVFLGYIGSVIDITERKRAEEVLRESEQRLQRMINVPRVGVLTFDFSGTLLDANDAFLEMVGYTREELRTRHLTWLDFTPPEYVEASERVMESLRKTGRGGPYEKEYFRKDGSRIWFMFVAADLGDGTIAEYAVDITDRKETEAALLEARNRLESSLTGANLGVWTYDVRTGEFWADERAKRMHGHKPDGVHSFEEASAHLHPGDRERAQDAFAHAIKEQSRFQIEFRAIHPDNSIHWIASFAQFVKRSSSDSGILYGIVQDITTRKQQEETLRLSEEKFRSLFESIDEGFVIVDMIFDKNKPVDYRFIEANPAFTRLTGLPGDALGKTARELVPDLEEFWFETYGTVALTGESVRFENYSAPMGRWFDVYASRVGDDTSRRVAIVFNNVTERKHAEQALRESEERFSKAFKASPLVLTISSLETGKLLEVNDTFVAITGYLRSEAVGKSTLELGLWAKPDDREAELEEVRKIGQLNNAEYVFRTRDGREITGLLSAERIDIGGKPCALTVIQDITERKIAAEKLRKSENQLRLVTDSLPALIAYVDNKKRYQFVNKTYSEWFGKTTADLIGQHVREAIGKRAYNSIKPFVERVLEGEPVSVHIDIQYRKIGAKFIHLVYVPDISSNGTVRGFYSLISDLTEVKRSEDLLRSSEERIALLMENIPDYAIFSINTEGVIESWNTGAEKIFGYSAEEILGKTSEMLFTPEDLARDVLGNEMLTARQKGRSIDERWLVRKDGSRFFASGVMMPLIVGKRLTGYAKIASDLTERKRRAEELQSAHDELELRVLQRTKELAETNNLLRQEIEQRKASEKHRVQLLHRIVSAQEAERKRIARDIHDQLGQRLTALRLKLASLRDLCTNDKRVAARVERLQEIASLLDSEVSFLASELRPTVLDDLGLEEAIRAYAGEWSGHFDIRLDFHSNGLIGKRYAREAETQFYRIAQEALNNVAKHSGATEVTVLMEQTAEALVLIVEDNGSGFDAGERSQKRDRGLGLVGMKERAILIGAELEIESEAGQGTTIFLRLPNRKGRKNNGRQTKNSAS